MLVERSFCGQDADRHGGPGRGEGWGRASVRCGRPLTGCGRHVGPRLPCPPHGEHVSIGALPDRARPFFASTCQPPCPADPLISTKTLSVIKSSRRPIVPETCHRRLSTPSRNSVTLATMTTAMLPGHRHRREGQAQYQPGHAQKVRDDGQDNGRPSGIAGSRALDPIKDSGGGFQFHPCNDLELARTLCRPPALPHRDRPRAPNRPSSTWLVKHPSALMPTLSACA